MPPRTAHPLFRRTAGLAALLAVTVGGGALTPADAADTPAAAPAAATAQQPAPTDLTIASFNVLGSSHTRGHGGYASGVRRTAGVVRLLARHDVEVVGLQEMQADQMRSFRHRTGGKYAMFPGPNGRREIDGENSVAWDRSVWEAVETRTFSIPYFHGNRRAMPLVKLRNRETGMTAWFANVHNPASTAGHRGSAKWRAKAIAQEARLASRLHDTGLPVFLTGDMNEREQAFCPLTSRAPLQAARGGSHAGGACRAGNPRYVDWAFGSPDLTFSGPRSSTYPLNKRTSDHPMIVTQASIDGAAYARAVQP